MQCTNCGQPITCSTCDVCETCGVIINYAEAIEAPNKPKCKPGPIQAFLDLRIKNTITPHNEPGDNFGVPI